AWKTFQVDHTREDALSNIHVLTICPDPKEPAKYLWIGTDGGGLNKLNISTGTFTHYSTSNGIPNNVIYAVQSDVHNNLWLSTNLGLCRFDPVSEEVWSFTIEDGLPGNEFNRMEYGKGSDGRLYFAGVEGVISFDPEDFYRTSSSSPIVINRLKLSNKEVRYSAGISGELKGDYHLSAPLELSQQLTFPYTERMITLGFSLLDFTNPDGNKYRYKLEGFNEEWIDAGDLNEAVFTNLSPGTYKFMVSGCNSNNIWSDPASLQLIIRPPWWATWWFRSILFMLVAAGVYGFYQYRLQQAMKIQHLRNRIAADLHDEIGSTLSSISLAGTVIQHKLKGKYQEVDGLLNKINNNTQTMMEAMSDIVWAVNTRNDRFDQILHRMRAFAVEILEPKDVMVHFEVNPHVIPLLLDMQQRKNLYLIFKEVIHNAAKYAQSNNVWVNLNYTYGKLLMEVRDDGVGFEVDPIHNAKLTRNTIETFSSSKGGNGIRNMFQRAVELKGKLEIQSSPGEGTKVSLAFGV
ncbi:MAG TPA: triple tyrosine motif-containing protein, partial [Saprospiraceae bacterium]